MNVVEHMAQKVRYNKPGLKDHDTATSISVIVSLRNNKDIIGEMHEQLVEALRKRDNTCEIIYVDDGSTDGTFEIVKNLSESHENVKAIRLRSTFGEASAFDAGIKKASGSLIVYMVGRVLVNPFSLLALIPQLQNGADLVVGWRHPRRDSGLNQFISKMFNLLVCKVAGIKLHDSNSGVMVSKREVFENVPLYGDLHSFLPILAHRQGYKIIEEKVEQLPGKFRKSRYPKEYLQRLLDIITVLFLMNYSKKPLHFLGFFGGIFLLIGVIIEMYLFIYRIFEFGPIAGRPLLVLGALLLVIGLQMISIGLIGEMIIFTHAKDVKEYNIAEIID